MKHLAPTLLVTALLMSACAGPQAPPPLYYQLRLQAPETVVQPAAEGSGGSGIWQLMGPLRLPEYLERDVLWLPVGESGLQPLPGHRWAEPLDEADPRACCCTTWRSCTAPPASGAAACPPAWRPTASCACRSSNSAWRRTVARSVCAPAAPSTAGRAASRRASFDTRPQRARRQRRTGRPGGRPPAGAVGDGARDRREDGSARLTPPPRRGADNARAQQPQRQRARLRHGADRHPVGEEHRVQVLAVAVGGADLEAVGGGEVVVVGDEQEVVVRNGPDRAPAPAPGPPTSPTGCPAPARRPLTRPKRASCGLSLMSSQALYSAGVIDGSSTPPAAIVPSMALPRMLVASLMSITSTWRSSDCCVPTPWPLPVRAAGSAVACRTAPAPRSAPPPACCRPAGTWAIAPRTRPSARCCRDCRGHR